MAGVARRRRNRAIEIEFLGRALTGKTAQPAQRHLEVARAEFERVVEVRELAPIPHLHRAPVPRPALPDAHALGVVAACAEGRSAVGADPLVAALVAFALFGEALPQRLHQFLPTA